MMSKTQIIAMAVVVIEIALGFFFKSEMKQVHDHITKIEERLPLLGR